MKFTAANQDPCSLDWKRHQPMWRHCMTWRALAAIRLQIAFYHYNKTWISISNRSMSVKDEKSLMWYCKSKVLIAQKKALY
jgi:hypothetical protein